MLEKTGSKDSRAETATGLAQSRYQERIARRPRSFLSVEDVSEQELHTLIEQGLHAKKHPDEWRQRLAGKQVAMLFEKTSTRTRSSIDVGVNQMGGHANYVEWRTSNFVLADLRDEVKVLSRYYDLIIARVNKHDTLRVMQSETEVPIINGLSDLLHPCQALADYVTMKEYFGALEGLRLTYIGDPNNVCRSLVHGAVKLGVRMRICSPAAYATPPDIIQSGGDAVSIVAEPAKAVADADVVYTDTWVSIGSESEASERCRHFAPFQINAELMRHAPPHTLVMHCLPAHPGQEIAEDVLRSPRSIVFDQAENRLHAQKPLMAMLLSTPRA